MSDWMMLTLVGADRPGIVSRVTRALCGVGCNLGEASMLRLGGNFTIMMMVATEQPESALRAALAPVADELGLRLHIDTVNGELHQHLLPNVQVRVSGADRTGIVADVTEALAAEGFHILELESDVAGDSASPLYIMNIQGHSERPVERLVEALAGLDARGVSVDVAAIDLMIG
ncbi:amino acid-binding protein [Marichromatium gracile]|uniref:Glycine cleavage system transcriptional repressor n=1 Tax=Marichromatium gracile TaxID=1048 RepID=A0A4V2W9B4_MARGR|nr:MULTISPECIES: ACT domain-containing protein [Marichromatium]MBK1709086.1 amino acid-binding protein [Marichromatium gracile]MCF1183237.1 amino acid-binding protein [Marichromatium gracile]RNE90041.1 amino acid-binding protein [Marichromatium sp. AB31]RNE94482.1 amino acid-binding protein [Marichromatium sp. AB32]TCW34730.1 glycine cleavage system transcriptional repressor [Marichromatium gracile]